ncbi:hypothetical protein KI372_02025 [Halobacterium salinarum]|nr:hypothetical protein [Halobacterium salinarum]
MTRHRASAPVVGKAAEAGIGVLVIAVFTTTLCGGVVPDARTAAASAVADRALEHAAAGVGGTTPLVLPARVDRVRGDWQPGHRANTTWVVRVCTPEYGGDLVVVLA